MSNQWFGIEGVPFKRPNTGASEMSVYHHLMTGLCCERRPGGVKNFLGVHDSKCRFGQE